MKPFVNEQGEVDPRAIGMAFHDDDKAKIQQLQQMYGKMDPALQQKLKQQATVTPEEQAAAGGWNLKANATVAAKAKMLQSMGEWDKAQAAQGQGQGQTPGGPSQPGGAPGQEHTKAIADRVVAKDPAAADPNNQIEKLKNQVSGGNPNAAKEPGFMDHVMKIWGSLSDMEKILVGGGLTLGAISLLGGMGGQGPGGGGMLSMLGPLLGIGALGYAGYKGGLFNNFMGGGGQQAARVGAGATPPPNMLGAAAGGVPGAMPPNMLGAAAGDITGAMPPNMLGAAAGGVKPPTPPPTGVAGGPSQPGAAGVPNQQAGNTPTPIDPFAKPPAVNPFTGQQDWFGDTLGAADKVFNLGLGASMPLATLGTAGTTSYALNNLDPTGQKYTRTVDPEAVGAAGAGLGVNLLNKATGRSITPLIAANHLVGALGQGHQLYGLGRGMTEDLGQAYQDFNAGNLFSREGGTAQRGIGAVENAGKIFDMNNDLTSGQRALGAAGIGFGLIDPVSGVNNARIALNAPAAMDEANKETLSQLSQIDPARATEQAKLDAGLQAHIKELNPRMTNDMNIMRNQVLTNTLGPLPAIPGDTNGQLAQQQRDQMFAALPEAKKMEITKQIAEGEQHIKKLYVGMVSDYAQNPANQLKPETSGVNPFETPMGPSNAIGEAGSYFDEKGNPRSWLERIPHPDDILTDAERAVDRAQQAAGRTERTQSRADQGLMGSAAAKTTGQNYANMAKNLQLNDELKQRISQTGAFSPKVVAARPALAGRLNVTDDEIVGDLQESAMRSKIYSSGNQRDITAFNQYLRLPPDAQNVFLKEHPNILSYIPQEMMNMTPQQEKAMADQARQNAKGYVAGGKR